MALTSRYLPTVDFADPHEEMSILETARRFVVSRDYHPGIKRIFHRVLIPAEDAPNFSPPGGWKIESIGPSFDPALPDAVSMTIWHPMPRVPTPRSILALASEFMGHGRGQITLSWLAPKLHLLPKDLLDLLLQAGLHNPTDPKDTNSKFAFAAGRVFWLTKDRANDPYTLHCKPPDSDPNKIDYEMPL